jgi:hypothetical protein
VAAPQCVSLDVGSTQRPPQSTSAGGQVVAHVPAAHTCPCAHGLPCEPLPPAPHAPEAPQNRGLVFGSMQLPPQFTWSGWHETAQPRFEHTLPCGHALPHAPQLASSELVSTHAPLHAVFGAPQYSLHAPWSQTWPGLHGLPHSPQSSKSLFRSTQAPLHCVCPTGHAIAHWPAPHTRGGAHVAPHTPQFFGSFVVSTQAAPHLVLGGAQVDASPEPPSLPPASGCVNASEDASYSVGYAVPPPEEHPVAISAVTNAAADTPHGASRVHRSPIE